jgi:hypothetical protein
MTSHDPETIAIQRAGNRATLGATALFLLTTVHHAYGAYIYDTPWRLHAAIVSGLATGLIAGSLFLFRRRPGDTIGAISRWVFIVVTLLVPILLFGIFEGAYNHVLKDALYFGGASPNVMRRLFPPPTYELPNNVFFEVTGVLQVVPAVFTAYFLYRFVRKQPRNLQRTAESSANAA